MKLKRCPFCGGEALIHDFKTYDNSARKMVFKFYVACKKCAVEMPATNLAKTEKEAVEAWNNRVTCEEDEE